MRSKNIISIIGILLPVIFQSLEIFAADDGATSAADLESLRGEAVFASPGNGNQSYQRTGRGNFARGNFVAEVTVTLHGGGGAGCAFFGIGRGEATPHFFNEPAMKPVVYARLAPGDFVGGRITSNVNGQEAGEGSDLIGDGTHRARLTWDAANRRALFEVCRDWDGKNFRADSSVTVSAASVNFGEEGHLFIGGANGVKYSDFAVKPLSGQEIKAAKFGESSVNDSTAGTWLPVRGAGGEQMRLLACWYNGASLAATRAFTNGNLQTAGSRWTCDVRETPADDGRDLTVIFRLTDGVAKSAGVAVAFDFDGWSTNNYVLIPASVYDGNRNRIEHRGYCTGFNQEDFYNKDIPQTTTDLPQLSPEAGRPSKLEVSACNASTPAICFFNPGKKRGFIVLSEQGIPRKNDADGTILDNAFAVEESADRSHATFVVSSPGVRERKPEFIGFGGSPDRGNDWKAGDMVTMHLRVYTFETPDIPGLLEKFMTVRKCVTGPNHPRNLIPFSQVIRLMTGRTDSHWHDGSPGHQYYSPEYSDNLCLGWVGGLMNTFPMLVLGDEMHRERVTKTFDFVIPAAQGKSGYFLATVHADGKASGRDWYPNQPIVLTRQNADVLFWMIKQFMLLKAQGHAAAIKQEWEQSIEQLAQAFVNTWKRHGQWGNYVNHETGDIALYNSTSGATAIGGLALASKYFKEPEFLNVAQEAADFYYQRDFVQKGFTYGACSDTMQNADSETAAGFMTALMALYETTGDAKWLEKSRNLANLVATWTVSYDYELPKNTELGALDAKLAGAVWASTQNKHGAPGICTSSGDPLFKIYRATGDRRYAELMRDIVHAHAEGIRPGGEINERLTYCDADSRGNRTAWGGSTGWNELNGFLMAMEIPGIYLQTDRDEMYVFDHVEADVMRRDRSGVILKIMNPTAYPARVAIFAESSKQANQALGMTAFLRWPQIELKPGGKGLFRITPDGAAVREYTQ